MLQDRDNDLRHTHAITNYLNAGYQGQFAFFNILSRFNHSEFSSVRMLDLKEKLSRVTAWTKDVWKGISLFAVAWTAPQTYEAEKALDFLAELRNDLLQVSQKLISILSADPAALNIGQLQYLVAALGRATYAKDNYIRGFIDYGKKFNLPDLVSQNSPLLPACAEEIKYIHALINTLKDARQEDVAGLLPELRYRNLLLPGTFRAQAHDIVQMLSIYQGGLTYEMAGISPENAGKWQSVSAPPQIAGYWEAYFIGPEEAFAWTEAGVSSHELAASWRLHGFNTQTAAPWAGKGFPPIVALRWARAGFEAEKAFEFVQKGVNDPSQLPKDIVS